MTRSVFSHGLPLAGRGMTYELLAQVVLPQTSMERRLVALRLELTPTEGDPVDVTIPLLQSAQCQAVLP